MENWIGGHMLTFLTNHHEWFTGFAIGAVLTHPQACALLLFNLFIRIPGMGKWIANNPDKAKGWFDAFNKAIDDAIDKYDKAHPELDDQKPKEKK